MKTSAEDTTKSRFHKGEAEKIFEEVEKRERDL